MAKLQYTNSDHHYTMIDELFYLEANRLRASNTGRIIYEIPHPKFLHAKVSIIVT